MKVSVTRLDLSDLDVDLLLIPTPEAAVDKALESLADTFDPVVRRAIADFKGKVGDKILLYCDKARARRVAFIGLGKIREVTAEGIRRAAAVGAGLARDVRADTVGIAVPETSVDVEMTNQCLVEGFMLASYRFGQYKTQEEDPFPGSGRLVLQTDNQDKAGRRGGERGKFLADAVMTARDLVNLSPHDKTPSKFARIIERSAKKHGYTVSVWDKALIEEEGMGGLLAVNRGSVEPPTFSVLEWSPDQPVNKQPIVLVGKGVVFDTGGLSLKPTENSMEFMKSDMAGAAAVIGTMEALAHLEVPLYVVGLIPATDNRPGVDAYVPGEVVRMHSGKTVEVLNTDAEGRMILADALSYAKTFHPELVIDLATLTGAAVVALGNVCAAVMTSESDGAEERVERMRAAGSVSGDRVHPLPMFDDYEKLIESSIADLKNIGGRGAGSITAAKFLEAFVDYPWIHLDIAGPAFLRESDSYRTQGGTGFGVRLLVEFLRTYSRNKGR